MEFGKRLDSSLPFYYYSTTDRFYEDLPSFEKPPEKPKQPKRAPRREQLGANVGRRITMAPRGTSSIRATSHDFPVDLPPPPPSQGDSSCSQSPMIIHTEDPKKYCITLQ